MDLPLYVIPDTPEILHSWVGMAAAAISAAGAVVGNMQKNSQAQREFEQYIVDMVAIDTQAAMQQEALVADAAQVQATTQQRKHEIEKNEMADQANAAVSAASSGTAGQSIEMTATEIESSAGRALATVDTQAANFFADIEQASRDIELSADAARMNFEKLDTSGQLLNIFGAGLQGFLSAR